MIRQWFMRTLAVMALWVGCVHLAASSPVVLANKLVRFALDEDGRITELIDLRTGEDYAAETHNRRLCSIRLADGTTATCTGLSMEGDTITAGFDVPETSLVLLLDRREGYFVLGLEKVVGPDVASVTMLNVATAGLSEMSGRMDCAYSDESVVGAFELDLPVDARPARHGGSQERVTQITATCYSRIGPVEGNRVAVYGCP